MTAILGIMLRGETLADDVDLDHIASETDGFSGSDLKRELGLRAPRLTCRFVCLCGSKRDQRGCQSSVEDFCD